MKSTKIFKTIKQLSLVILTLLAFQQIMPVLMPDDGSGVTYAPMGAAIAFACRSLQGKLITYFGDNIASLRTLGDTGYLKWLLSPQNTAGFRRISDDIQGVPGKKRGVAFRVDTPFCFNLCALTTTCETVYTTVTSLDQELVFELTNPPFRHCDDEGEPIKLQFDEEELTRFCTETDTSYIEEKISRYLLRWEEALDYAIAVKLQTEIGNNGSDEAITNLPFFTQSNQFQPNMAALNPEAIWALNEIYRKMGGKAQYALIGDSLVSKLAQYQKWATFNAAGVDISKADPSTPYAFIDQNFGSLFGPKDMILFTPGAQQLVTWNKYKGEKRREVTNLYSKGTVVLPRTGIEVDWKWWYDYNCEKWTFEAFLHAELATVPKGGCGANLANVNGIIRVHDCGTPAILPVCPEEAEA